MVKSLIRQYMREYKWSHFREQIKKCPQVIFFPIWLACITLEILVEDSLRNGAVSLLVSLPMMHIYFAGILHSSVRLNKMMYLCPMDAARRRAFVYSSYFFGIGIRMVPALAGILVMFRFASPDALSVAGILCSDLLIASTLPWEGTDVPIFWISTPIEITKEALYKIFIIYIAGICNVFLTDILMDGGESREMEIVPLGILILIEIPLFIRYHKFIKAELEHAVEYENT